MNVLSPALISATLLLIAGHASAQSTTLPEACGSIAGTFNMAAPSSGSITISPLSKYGNFPANACITMSGDMMTLATGGSINYKLATAMAINYNNVSVPASCYGAGFAVNGGPVHSYIVADGVVNVGPGGQNISGTTNATVYMDVDNLSVTLNGATYMVDTGLETMRAITTFSGNTSSTKICLSNGLRSTVNGQPMVLPANLWQCVAGSGQSNVTYATDC